jgi:hypothetical protein
MNKTSKKPTTGNRISLSNAFDRNEEILGALVYGRKCVEFEKGEGKPNRPTRF